MYALRGYQCESCVTSPEQAFEAQRRGADRIELCVRLETEGMTPDADLVAEVLDTVSIPVRVMIRHTEAGYAADDKVLGQMLDAIDMIRSWPVEGFVYGLLEHDRIDRARMEILLEHSFPFPVTFHKAIDAVTHLEEEIRWMNRFPQMDTLLTSGRAVRAIDGLEGIRFLRSLFNGQIMAAGKITPEILPQLHAELGLPWYHGRAIV